MTAFEPNIYGRMYSVAPLPYGGTHCLFAFTVAITASMNFSFGNFGMTSLSQDCIMRSALRSGRKVTMRPSSVVYALSPSKQDCEYWRTPAHSVMTTLSSVVSFPLSHLPFLKLATKRLSVLM